MLEGEGDRRGDRVTEVWVYLAIDATDNCEGILAIPLPMDGGLWPMAGVGADRARIESLRPVVQAVASAAGQKVRLVRFTQRDDMELIEP